MWAGKTFGVRPGWLGLAESLLAHLRGGFLRGMKELPVTLARGLAHRAF